MEPGCTRGVEPHLLTLPCLGWHQATDGHIVCALVDLASVLTPEIMAPILANADVQERLLPYLPSGESLPQTADEIQNTLTSPQFQQVCPWHALYTLYLERGGAAVLGTQPCMHACFVAGPGYVQCSLGLGTARPPHVPVRPSCRGRGGRQQRW